MAQFQVLGPPEAYRGGEAIPLSGRQRTLLAVLLADRGSTVPTDRLVHVLWRGAPPVSAVASLHSHVSRLRSALREPAGAEPREDVIRTGPGGYCLRADEGTVDADVFDALVRRAEAALSTSPSEAADLLDRALALWRGHAFAGYDDEDFARPEAARLEERRLWAVEERAAALLACGREPEAAAVLERMLSEQPLRERARGQLMVALYRTGRQAEALRVYQRYRATLVEELGLDPSPQLQQIERDILQHSRDLVGGRVTGATGPERQRMRRLRADSFVGRTRECGDVVRLLSRARLVTVVGPGGVGKTRLAEHVASQVAPGHPDGVLFCDLAAVGPGAVVQELAGAVGARAAAHRPLREVVVDALSAKALLLLVDNCDHVIADAGSLLEQVVAGGTTVRVLATSREPLAVPGEHVYRLEPLATGPVDQDGPPPAVQLFADRAAAASGGHPASVDADLALDICRALDGVPLAIELAAARTAVMHPVDLRRRLDERFHLLAAGPGRQERHRSLKAVVEWSYDLLTEPEARLFDRLSVFASGFTIDAAVGVCSGQPVEDRDVAGLLAQLADRSLVAVDGDGPPTRYRLLETLRQYGYRRLSTAGELARWRDRHLQWCLELAERAAAGIDSPDCGRWVRTVTAEFSNVRAAHEWARAQGDLGAAFRLTTALERYALQQLHDEVFAWAEQLLDLPDADEQPLLPLVAGTAALGAGIRGDFDATARHAGRGLAVAADADDPRRLLPLAALAEMSLYRGDLDDELALAAQAGDLARQVGDVFHEGVTVLHHVLACTYSGKHARAREHVRRLHELARRRPGTSLEAWALYADGEAMLAVDPETAQALLKRSIEAARTAEDRFVEGVALVSATSVAVRSGCQQEALRALAGAVRHWHERGDLTHQRVTIRLLVELLGRLGRAEAAAVLLAATTENAMAPPSFDEHSTARDARLLDALRARLGEERFARARVRGAALNAHEVAPVALAEVEDALRSRRTDSRSRAAPSSSTAPPASAAREQRGATTTLAPHRGR